MAKKPVTSTGNMVTVQTLSQDFGIPAALIRKIIRANGKRAPRVNLSGGEFGPRARYQWENSSVELKEIKAFIQTAIDTEKSPDSNSTAETKTSSEQKEVLDAKD